MSCADMLCSSTTHLLIQPEISTSGQKDTGWESCADTLYSRNTPVSTTRDQYIRTETHSDEGALERWCPAAKYLLINNAATQGG